MVRTLVVTRTGVIVRLSGMKLIAHPIALALIATSVLATISGCASSNGDARPGEVTPRSAQRRPPLKGPQSAIPITVVKVVPSPTPPLAKGKKRVVRSKIVNVPADTNVPFTFSIASEFWPTGVESVSAVIKCYQVASVYPTSTGYAITTVGSALPVFGGTATSKTVTITPDTPQTQQLTFSSSSCQNKQLIVGISGTGEDGNEDEFDFGGGDIFVVSE